MKYEYSQVDHSTWRYLKISPGKSQSYGPSLLKGGAPRVINWFVIPLTSSIYHPQTTVKLELYMHTN